MDKLKTEMGIQIIPNKKNPPNNRQWSETFQQYVDDIEGEDVPGQRVLVQIADDLVDLPASWVESIVETQDDGEDNSTG